MSEDISSTVDDAKLHTEDDIAQNTVPNTTDETNDTSKNSPAETVDKTPISSATPFKEPLKNKDDDPVPLVTDRIESAEATEGFNETECVKFAEKLYKIVEELRIGRISEKENELRIQKLMSEKNDLERLKDDEALKNQDMIQKHSTKEDEIRKQFDDKFRSFQEEKTKHMLERQSGEQEMKALKDEIRSLHINKYNMEKMMKDQERQIQIHGTSHTNYLTQMAKVENQCKDIFKQCSQVLETVDKVEANMHSSTKLNKKLSFMNDHQKCIVQTYKEKFEKTKQELISVQASTVSSSAEGEASSNTKESMVQLEDELRMQKELCQQVQLQLNDSRQEIQGLLKSLDNAHSLLAKHVETNNKYAESELILQLELDDSKTDCEKYKDELTTQKADIQEKDAQINELKNTMKEKEEQLSEQIKKLGEERENLKKEKQSLEELNSNWSQKIVEQKDEIEEMKNKQIEMEASIEEMRKKLDVKDDEVETLEEKLMAESSRHKDLVQIADEEKDKNSNEAEKWRKRTTELLQIEEELRAELDKVKKENKMKEPQNQYTQTEIAGRADKETNTISIFTHKSTMLEKGTTTENTTSEVQHNQEKSNVPAEKQPSLERKTKSAIDIDNELRLPIKPQNVPIATSNNTTKLPQNTASINEKPNIAGITNQQPPSIKEATKNCLSSGPVNTVVQNVSTLEGKDTVLSSSQQAKNGVPQNTSAPKIHSALNTAIQQNNSCTQNNNSIQQSQIIAAQSGSMAKPIHSPLKDNNNSLSKQSLGVADQHRTTPSLIAPDSEIQNPPTPRPGSNSDGKPTKMMRGIPENVMRSKTQRKPLLAVVKPSSAEKLPQPTGNQSSVTDSKRGRSEVFCTPMDNNITPEATKEKATKQGVALLEKPNLEQDKQSRSKRERKSINEDFCFSDDEDESIPRAIGSQVDRIETFLKNERLRLSKKRKAVDE